MIGTPLQIDDFTFNQSKLSKARVGIEIDLTKPLVEEFDLKINEITIHQKVEYEQVPKYCNLCKNIGHDSLECYSKGNAPCPPLPHPPGNGSKQSNIRKARRKWLQMNVCLWRKVNALNQLRIAIGTTVEILLEDAENTVEKNVNVHENDLHVSDKEAPRDIKNEITCAKTVDYEAEVEGLEVRQLIQAVKPVFPEFLRMGHRLRRIKTKDVFQLLKNLK
ncbi:UNVERIFIED_CONTAM: hypothetical protein Sangu_2873200 [Sesamum angustifolium]|uniref:DUF4283 domain-containing protein n=1 Tax=Sesamum angustifolium TaxID=2727405 RepID=A0AAW2IMZ1_9LAMI